MQDKLIKDIVELCVKKYKMLPKTGKPIKEEWTVVAAIVEDLGDVQKIVSLGTGSKCVGVKSLSPLGDVLHDSHAEVMARRGFLLYLMSQVECALIGDSHLFNKNEDGRLDLKENVKFWFVCSAVPCGDAAIMPKENSSDGNSVNIIDDEDCSARKRQRLLEQPTAYVVDDIHRTGAKCVAKAVQDSKASGSKYHVIGQVRTKPGRGDPTASVSCSDKLARWNAVGVQGALLSLILHRPIFFTALIVTGNTPFSDITLERAINFRIGSPGKMKFFQSCISFDVEKNETRKRPAPCSIAYYLPGNKTEIAVEGRRLGTTKKNSAHSALAISKIGIYQQFSNILEKYSNLHNIYGVNHRKMTYREMKDLSTNYQKKWSRFKEECFKAWTIKPISLEKFNVPST